MSDLQGLDTKKRRSLTAADLFVGGGGKIEWIDLPELDGGVYLRHLSAKEVLQYTEARRAGDEGKRTHAQNVLIARAVVDENGQRIVSDDEADQFGETPIGSYMRIVRRVTSGMGGRDEDDSEKAAAPATDGDPTTEAVEAAVAT